MTFPQTIQDIKTELELDGVWTDVSGDVRRDPGINIKRGRADESRRVSPSSCTLVFDNRSGNYSPRNPLGAYYGTIGRNTPIRTSIASDKAWLYIDLDTGDIGDFCASTPDVAALDITPDVDLRFEADLDTWHDTMELVSKWTTTGNQRSYGMAVSSGGYLRMFTSVAGTVTTVDVVSTQPLPTLYGRQAVRATLDGNNGAAGNTATFYYSDTISGTWIQLGDPVITAGTTTLFVSTALLYVGPRTSGGPAFGTATRGKIYAAEVRSSIGGTIVANPDFTAQAEGVSSFADSTGKTWTVVGTTLTKRDFRFRGEVSAWPQKWDRSGSDVYAEIEGSGILRRLGQGQTPVPSSLKRSISAETINVAYWPAEDGELAESIGSAYPNGSPMIISGTPALAANSDLLSSLPLPTLNFASLAGNIGVHTSTDSIQVRMYLSIPAAGITNGTTIASLGTTGTARTFDLVYGTGGDLYLDTYGADGALLYLGTGGAFAVDGRPCYVVMMISDNGTGVDTTIQTINAATEVITLSTVDNVAAAQAGRATRLVINPKKQMDDVVMGHFSVANSSPAIGGTIGGALRAWIGEAAGTRITRLCSENSIPLFPTGNMADTARMGPQRINTAVDLLQEAADADLGILYEPRDQYGLVYRPRKTLNNQGAVVTASYSSSHLSSFEPIDDDQNTINDITLTRIGGSSYRAVDETSALSTQQPPDGVGVYDEATSVSLYEDSQLPDQAGWRLHLGTIDEARYPVIGFDLTSPSFLATTNLTFDVLALDIGDRLVATDSPAWLPPDDVQQIAQGFTEYLANFERRISANCSPASPWEIARYAAATVSGGNQYKYGSDGTVTAEALDTTETGVDVTTASGPVWTTEAAQMPIDIIIGGERMSVTAVSGTGSAQTFTVARSVNGIVKSHATGAAVALFRPAVYGF